MRNRFSLRTRLLIAVGAISIVALGLADVVVFGSLRTYLYKQVDSTLEASHRSVEATANDPGSAAGISTVIPGDGQSLVPTPRTGGPSTTAGDGSSSSDSSGRGADGGASAFCAIGRESAPGMFIEVRNATSGVVTSVAGREECPAFQPGSVAYLPRLPTRITGFSRSPERSEPTTYLTVASTTRSGPAFRVRASELANGDLLVLATPISNVTNALSQLLLIELLVTAGALVTAVLLGLWLVRIGLRPLRDVERTAEAIAGGDLMHRVPNANPRTEVGHLATAFNVMLGTIEGLVTDLRSSEFRLRRFVGDASHELRTPIAAISAYAELVAGGASSRQADRDRAISGIAREATRMGRLVEDLLTLTKVDAHHVSETEPVELVDLVIEAVETARTVGPGWPLQFIAEDAVEVLGNRGALRQVVDNLLSNVRAHTPVGTRATVSVVRRGPDALIVVEDEGPGMSEADAALIFERFFRVDPSRSRETGGAGLGLAIVASIASAHGGRVTAVPRPGGGTRFEVTLPAIDDTAGPLNR